VHARSIPIWLRALSGTLRRTVIKRPTGPIVPDYGEEKAVKALRLAWRRGLRIVVPGFFPAEMAAKRCRPRLRFDYRPGLYLIDASNSRRRANSIRAYELKAANIAA
jgi:hypothetical protein